MLTLRPVIYGTKKSIVIKTGLLTRLISLFSYMHKVEIFSEQKKILFYNRIFWLFYSFKELDFNDISYIDYSYNSYGTSWGRTIWEYKKLDEVESYSVYLVTKNGDKHFVCSFSGEGYSCTGLSGVLIANDSVADFAGTQGDESRQFVEYLSKQLGVSIGKSIKDVIDMKICPQCHRETSPYDTKCLYCGAELQ